jgi:hypothetical protein
MRKNLEMLVVRVLKLRNKDCEYEKEGGNCEGSEAKK